MLTDDQLTRLAKAAHALRPDWPTTSIRTHLADRHAHRDYPDVALALVAVAIDLTTRTPARLDQQGPWRGAARAAAGWHGDTEVEVHAGPGDGVTRCARAGHEYEPAHACRWCRSEALAGEA